MSHDLESKRKKEKPTICCWPRALMKLDKYCGENELLKYSAVGINLWSAKVTLLPAKIIILFAVKVTKVKCI